MSDGEDDFMCEEEEDYGLVSFHAETVQSFCRTFLPARGEVRISGAFAYRMFKNSLRDTSRDPP